MRFTKRGLMTAVGAAYLMACSAGGSSTPTSLDNTTATTVPSAPTNLTATVGDKQATFSFTAPTSLGGSAITTYTVTCVAGTETRANTRSASPILVSGLTNGVTYSCTVSAKNAVGEGPASAAVSVTPGATH